MSEKKQPDELKEILKREIRQKRYTDFQTDFKATVIAAGLVDYGFPAGKIKLVRQGPGRRGFSKEVEDINFQHIGSDQLLIKVNKEGIYDILPESLFHKTTHARFKRNKEDVIEEIKQQRQEEHFARRFFQLFEMEIDQVLMQTHLHELQFDKRISHPMFQEVFKPLSGIIPLLNRRQTILFVHILPGLYQIKGDIRKTAQALSTLLDITVDIRYIKIKDKEIEDGVIPSLGDGHLAIDSVLYGAFDDGISDIKITFGPVTNQQLIHFCHEENGTLLIDRLCRLFLPAGIRIIKEYIPVPEETECILSNTQPSYLGVNTYI